MTDYAWRDRHRDGRTQHVVFEMLSAVQEARALFVVPTIKLAEQITYALRTAYEAGQLLGAEPGHVPNHRTDKDHDAPTRAASGWTVPARTYTLPEYDRLRMRTGTFQQYQRAAITVRTGKLAQRITRELDRARYYGMRNGTDARHYACHGHYGNHSGPAQNTRCANCGRVGQIYVPAQYDANCDRLAMLWLTAEVTDWRNGDKLCAECVASLEWDTAEWDVAPRPDGITLYTHR